ncbi:MAG: PQQ-dependent sugar dehydrogenase [Phycisphaerales bacterium]|nr:PQQ-dependent sugar dehydrogenase [Phycisphaerales bacterium]
MTLLNRRHPLTIVRRVATSMVVLCACAWSHAQVLNFNLTLDGSQEVPPVDTMATGLGTATLDLSNNLFSWNFSYENLSSGETAAHFHAPAALCQTAPPSITLPLGSPKVGSQVVTSQQRDQIIQGLWYVNVHTSNHPGGEIRGQVEPEPISDPLPGPIPLSGHTVRLETVADGMTAPNWAAPAPGIAGRLYVSDQTGIIWNVDLSTGAKSTFLDASSRLVPLGIFGQGTFDERGLLGVAFHPGYASNGLLYTYTSEPFDPNGPPADFSTMPQGTDPNHQTVIIEWRVNNPTDPNATVDPNSARVLMRIDQPQFNHNGGCVNFGPDGMLYISLGDGGNADDQDTGIDPFGVMVKGHGCKGNGQDKNTILGSVVRIDPQGNNSANGQYGIPGDNPFVNADGLDELFAYGLRNPFRFSFDSVSGALLLGDVGQNDIEEVNIIESGRNYGWNLREGTFRFVRNGARSGYAADPDGMIDPGLTDPIAQYDHDEGISVIGGFVYRGNAMPALNGTYIFAEFGQQFNNDGRLLHLDENNGIQEFRIAGGGEVDFFILGMGQDANGEIYALANNTGVPFDTTGKLVRISPPLSLAIGGTCPGMMTATAGGATPGGRVAFIRATGTGSQRIPQGNPCAGTTLGLDRTAVLVASPTANNQGQASISGNVPQNACGNVFLQALDIQTCTTSNVAGL